MPEDGELALGDSEGFFLQGIDAAVLLEEPDEMAGRSDGQRPEDVMFGGPLGKRQLPWQVEQRRGVLAQAKTGERVRQRAGQSLFRRYVVTVAS